MGYTWLGMRKLTWEEVLQRHEKGELAGCFRPVSYTHLTLPTTSRV